MPEAIVREPGMGAAVHLPRSTLLDFSSTSNGRSYRLMISAPFAEPPAAGWPVLCVLDGQGYHGFVTEATRSLALAREAPPVLVVAVGTCDDAPASWLARRTLDLTPTLPRAGAETAAMRVAALGGAGGLDGFLDMLQSEALERVAALFPIDRRRMALWGHSLGGLAVLYALMARATPFESHLAISPSIWWDGCALLAHEAGFAERVGAGQVAARVFIGVGGLEDRAPEHLPPGHPGTLEELAAVMRSLKMVGNARALAERLQALRAARAGAAPLDVRFICAADETHAAAPFATLRAALALAFPWHPPSR